MTCDHNKNKQQIKQYISNKIVKHNCQGIIYNNIWYLKQRMCVYVYIH